MSTYTQQAFVWIGFFVVVCIPIAVGLIVISKTSKSSRKSSQQVADVIAKAHEEVRREAERRASREKKGRQSS